MTGLSGLLGLLGLAAVLLAVTAAPAAAHATLTGSSPADGEVVATAPERVVLTFSERVLLGDDAISVLDPQGERADTGELTDLGGDGTVRHAVTLRRALADGTYTVAWQAVSADSHPVSGAFTFSVGAPSATSAALPEQGAGEGPVALLYDTGRYAAYAGFLLLAGVPVFTLLCWPGAARQRAVQRLAVAGWTTATAATLALLVLRSAYTGSGELADAADLAGLQEAVGTRTGTALASRLLLLAAAAVVLALLLGPYARAVGAEGSAARQRRGDLTFGVVLGGTAIVAGLAATWSTVEHASTGPQTAVAIPADLVHLLAAAGWLGGLATVLVLLSAPGAGLPAAAVRRYSRLATGCVLVLAATGLYQSWRQVGSLSALTGTGFGLLLITKTALVVLLVAVGWMSRRWTALLRDEGAPPGSAQAAGPEPAAGSPTGSAAPGPTEPGPTHSGPGAGAGRARQLARQREAVARARRRKAQHADPHRAGLRRTVLTETVLAALVLLVTTVLTGAVPGRTASGAGAENGAGSGSGSRAGGGGPVSLEIPYDTGGISGQGTARLDLDPGRTGKNTLHILLTGPGGRPAAAEEIRFALTLPAEDPAGEGRGRDIGPLRYTPARVGTGHWSATDVRIPRPGDWEVSFTIRTSDIDQITETSTLTIG